MRSGPEHFDAPDVQALARAQQAEMRAEAQKAVDDAAVEAEQAPIPTFEEIEAYVYAARD